MNEVYEKMNEIINELNYKIKKLESENAVLCASLSNSYYYRGFHILEKLPNHLMLARNSNAPEFDRWRLYSLTHEKYLEETGSKTAIECIEKYIAIEDNDNK